MDLKELAKKENIGMEKLGNELRLGRAVVLYHKGTPACILSKLCPTKLNTNMGVSTTSSIKEEMEKLKLSEYHGTDTVMDLSTRNTVETLKVFLENSSVPVGTVPIYDCYPNPAEDDFLKSMERHVKTGASFVTVHAAFKKEAVPASMDRVTRIVSRGGGILADYMIRNKAENPLYKNFDYLLENVFSDSQCSISLGDALRPGCLADANDKAQLAELRVQGELVLKAREKGVQVFCEGPGHMPFDTIADNVKLQKEWCHGAPYYVLGPLVTDTALGYDHINAAIGATVAAIAGVEFLCVLTPSEHYRLPTIDDIKEGVIAYKIAAHAADICTLGTPAKRDLEMSKGRYALNWTVQEELSITRKKVGIKNNAPCSMCNQLCPMKKTALLESQYEADAETAKMIHEKELEMKIKELSKGKKGERKK